MLFRSETSGFKPIPADNGIEGLEIARQKKPALVILDIMMPKDSGINLYRELKTDPDLKEIPVIMVSAVAKKTFLHSQKVLDEHKGEKVAEPEGYIEKPPEADELLDLINSLLS